MAVHHPIDLSDSPTSPLDNLTRTSTHMSVCVRSKRKPARTAGGRHNASRNTTAALLTKTPTPPTLHFVFGYGSLINPISVSKTLPRPPLSLRPCSVRGLTRAWNYNCNDIYTAVGVDPALPSSSRTNGVLLHLPDSADLPLLDLREKCYVRIRIPHSYIIGLELPASACVWVYVNPPTLRAHVPSPAVPIPQSYVDCIITGCLRISKTFAEEFVRSTDGWEAAEGAWVDDRHSDAPRYRRKEGAPRDPWEEIDGVLKSALRGEELSHRVVVEPERYADRPMVLQDATRVVPS